ncbi:MAG TPA: diguanylate cyclase [Dehalococcoidia bacterium]
MEPETRETEEPEGGQPEAAESVDWVALADALQELYAAETPARCIQSALAAAAEHLGASFLLVLLLDQEERSLTAAHLAEIDHMRVSKVIAALDQDPAELVLPVDGERARILRSDGPTVTGDFRALFAGAISAEQCEEAQRVLHIRTVISLPLAARGRRLGIASLWYRRPSPGLKPARKLVEHLALALWTHQAEDRARQYGNIDPETWVFNRRYLFEAGRRELYRARKHERPLSLAVLDLVDIGRFEEEYGPTLAAKVLRSVAVRLAGAASPIDVVARYEDGRFVVLLPETDRAGAEEQVTRLIEELGEDPDLLPVKDGPEMRIAAAVASFPEDGASLEALIRSAKGSLPQPEDKGESQEQAAGGVTA